jgi:enamine deaminase RidA (YjgF/YER057c/UK114 family)
MVMEVDGRVELSGQGGWDPVTLEFPTGHDIEAEVAQAFDNVTFMLGEVGLDWSNVGHVNSYHTVEPDGTILAATAEMRGSSVGASPLKSQSGPALGAPHWATPG